MNAKRTTEYLKTTTFNGKLTEEGWKITEQPGGATGVYSLNDASGETLITGETRRETLSGERQMGIDAVYPNGLVEIMAVHTSGVISYAGKFPDGHETGVTLVDKQAYSGDDPQPVPQERQGEVLLPDGGKVKISGIVNQLVRTGVDLTIDPSGSLSSIRRMLIGSQDLIGSGIVTLFNQQVSPWGEKQQDLEMGVDRDLVEISRTNKYQVGAGITRQLTLQPGVIRERHPESDKEITDADRGMAMEIRGLMSAVDMSAISGQPLRWEIEQRSGRGYRAKLGRDGQIGLEVIHRLPRDFSTQKLSQVIEDLTELGLDEDQARDLGRRLLAGSHSSIAQVSLHQSAVVQPDGSSVTNPILRVYRGEYGERSSTISNPKNVAIGLPREINMIDVRDISSEGSVASVFELQSEPPNVQRVEVTQAPPSITHTSETTPMFLELGTSGNVTVGKMMNQAISHISGTEARHTVVTSGPGLNQVETYSVRKGD